MKSHLDSGADFPAGTRIITDKGLISIQDIKVADLLITIFKPSTIKFLLRKQLMNYVFFDIDGTLHKEDIFFEFIKYSIKERLINFVIFLPIIFISFLLYLINKKGKLGLNFILFFLFFGISEKQLDILTEKFCKSFSQKMTSFDKPLKQLEFHKVNGDEVIFISGTPVEFIKQIYPNFFNTSNFEVIGSITCRKFFSFYLVERCIYKNKKTMLNNIFKADLNFSHGYSDSLSDLPILTLCDKAYLVDKDGSMTSFDPEAAKNAK